MKILIVSDTHGNLDNLRAVLARTAPVDVLVHLGDLGVDENEITEAAGCPVYMVPGNNDWYLRSPSDLLVPLGGKKVFMTHGHAYGVSYGLNRLLFRARELEADIVMFGHTHVPLLDLDSSPWIMNPGSISLPRSGSPGYILAEVSENGTWDPKLMYL